MGVRLYLGLVLLLGGGLGAAHGDRPSDRLGRCWGVLGWGTLRLVLLLLLLLLLELLNLLLVQLLHLHVLQLHLLLLHLLLLLLLLEVVLLQLLLEMLLEMLLLHLLLDLLVVQLLLLHLVVLHVLLHLVLLLLLLRRRRLHGRAHLQRGRSGRPRAHHPAPAHLAHQLRGHVGGHALIGHRHGGDYLAAREPHLEGLGGDGPGEGLLQGLGSRRHGGVLGQRRVEDQRGRQVGGGQRLLDGPDGLGLCRLGGRLAGKSGKEDFSPFSVASSCGSNAVRVLHIYTLSLKELHT